MTGNVVLLKGGPYDGEKRSAIIRPPYFDIIEIHKNEKHYYRLDQCEPDKIVTYKWVGKEKMRIKEWMSQRWLNFKAFRKEAKKFYHNFDKYGIG